MDTNEQTILSHSAERVFASRFEYRVPDALEELTNDPLTIRSLPIQTQHSRTLPMLQTTYKTLESSA
ncbi:hypothetical protein BGAL_0062g00150 [Botrytis galanthina]|uniref:Uncharacterized protein n=1 Tax=Botrytis galanthina TaxID=278940 RepID=A0A4S8RER5_9HELO|nr:hypothetical protein BGAL_0062g00150 [Botrytis galanthina]